MLPDETNFGSSRTLQSNISSSAMSSSRNPVVSQAPPPVPPRPQNSTYNRYNSNFSGYMPYNRFTTTPYSNYGTGLPFGNRYSYPQQTPWDAGDAESTFIRLAEESSRPAFQSIESIVNAVGSITMMLESTYHAVYSSYRAVLGMVENFSRLRNQLANVLSALTLVRSLHWLCLKILYILGIRKSNPLNEGAWSAAAHMAAKDDIIDMDSSDSSSWPIFMFLSLVFGAPWLIFHIFSRSLGKKHKESSEWIKGKGNHYTAIAMYDFQSNAPGELTVRAGQHITLAPKILQPKVRGWLLATVDGKKTGLIPANYIRILPVKKAAMASMESENQTVNAAEEN